MATGITIKADIGKLQNLINSSPDALDRAVAAAGEELVNTVKLSMMESPSTGRTYSRTKSGRRHVASSPGKPPRPDMGTLINSIRAKRQARMSYRIQDGVEYGILLEVGTEKMEARPFMRPAFEEFREGKFSEIIKQQLGI